MRLIIKNAKTACINPAAQPSRLNVDIAGIEIEDILFQVNIDQAINYFGITELLDTIGDQEIKSHLLNSEGITHKT
ncbi:Fn3-like domain-containing protein [Chitinophaga sp. 180180018-2]|nr:Fn3-like domain-containing protein [Chitinophaga sp. 212800010-3]